MFKERFINLIDVRNVHKASNTAYKETVAREEMTYHINPQWTAKGLFRWHGLPKTTQNVDPFLSNFYLYVADVEDPLFQNGFQNLSIKADQDPSRFTYAGALQYVHDKQWTFEGFVERSNDIPDFPRGLLNDTFRDHTDQVDSLLIDHTTNFLYDQTPFGLPPYPWFTIFRERVIYKPEDRVTLTLHAAQNSYKFAVGIDDNINHVGLSGAFVYNEKLSFFADYTYSMQIDVPRMIATNTAEQVFGGHHNVYLSMDYKVRPDTVFRTEYGVFGMGTETPLVTPYSTTAFSLPTIDTEHIFRVSLTGDF